MKLTAQQLESMGARLVGRATATAGRQRRRLGAQGLRPRKFVAPSTIVQGSAAILTLPLLLVTLANQREHWTVRNRRASDHRNTVRAAVASAAERLSWWKDRETLGVSVFIERLGPRRIDPHTIGDAVAKNVVDGVADAIALGKEIQKVVLGVTVGTGRYNDDDDRISWDFGQEFPSAYGVRIRIEPREAPC